MVNELSSDEPINTVFTIIKTSKYQTTGETGLKIWMNQLNALFKVGLNPMKIPSGTAMNSARKNPAKTVFKLLKIWSTKDGLPVYTIGSFK